MTPPRWVPIIAALVAAANSHSQADSRSARQTTPAVLLSDGATYERGGVEGETSRYETLLAAGDFLEVKVSQDQLLVHVSVRGPDGGVLHSIFLPAVDPLPQRLMFVAPVSGVYRLEMRISGGFPAASELKKRSGADSDQRTYTLQVIALRQATSADRVRAGWFDMLERASALANLRTMDGLRQAVPVFRQAAAGWRAAGDTPLEIATLESLATLTGFFTQFGLDSSAARERLTVLYPETEEREGEVRNWRHLAVKYSQEGRLGDAKEAVSRAMDLALALGLHVAAARSQRELGNYEFALGNYQTARELAQRAYDLAAAIPDRAVEALTTWDLARLDDLAGDLDAAITRTRRALTLAEGDGPATTLTTMWLGFYYLQRGELDEAASNFEARLAMARTSVQRDQESLTRLGLGDVSRALGDREGARRRYEAAASELAQGAQPFRCIAEQRLGRMELEDGRLDQARAHFESMLEISTARHDSPCEAEGRAGLADVAAGTGDLVLADTQARRVLELTEAFREAAVSLESRSLGFGVLAPAYERAIDISMRLAERGDPASIARALSLNEQALARGLLDRIVEARLDASARAPAALVTEHHDVRERWRARLAELQVAMQTHAGAPDTLALAEETRLLAVQVRDLEARVDTADARYGSFVRPRALSVSAIQALLDDDTLFLEYGLGDARSYLWVVSSHDIRAFTLAPRAAIEAVARRVHESFGRPPAAAKVPNAGWMADQRALTHLVLEPAASLLGARRLVVIPTGALSLVPFGALAVPGASTDGPALITQHEIVQIPSATILAAMRALTARREPPSKVAAIFADPIFDPHDSRVRSPSSMDLGRSAEPADEPHASTLPRTLVLSRLPFSRDEATAIASLVPGGVTMFVGAEATREHVLQRALADYRFIHFATHSVVNQEVPGLSSIALSMVDSAGGPHDGFVMLPDIYDMTLNADVVVLSGCQTALGKNVRGEGPLGLARGFMYAGAPRVVASLWQVSDRGTAELMKRFYRGMLVEGLTPAAALRAAQRGLAANPRWASPYFWAPFILEGDWR
jgi:CHAT domain-containing protein/tetratricopeptide (TPR) repeat protein